ncbi:MAG: DUF2062 domain-containing protein [Nitrospiraceae bacterium]|nr:MAG: DUF2062 domain-containing protein [Nitrospiraceae bacterium]
MAHYRDKFKSILKVKDSPRRIALAFAVGVFMGISPFLGLHYIGGFFLAWLFRLNKLVTFVGVSVNNPWTIVPISSFGVWTGAKIMGIKQVLPEVDWKQVSMMGILGRLTDLDQFLTIVWQLMPLIKAFFVGSFVICTASAAISYVIIHVLASRYRKV